MLFRIGMTITNVDSSEIVREVGSDSFTPAVQHYLSALEHCKGEVRWGNAREARIVFQSMGHTTESTTIRFGVGGELMVVQKSYM